MEIFILNVYLVLSEHFELRSCARVCVCVKEESSNKYISIKKDIAIKTQRTFSMLNGSAYILTIQINMMFMLCALFTFEHIFFIEIYCAISSDFHRNFFFFLYLHFMRMRDCCSIFRVNYTYGMCIHIFCVVFNDKRERMFKKRKKNLYKISYFAILLTFFRFIRYIYNCVVGFVYMFVCLKTLVAGSLSL